MTQCILRNLVVRSPDNATTNDEIALVMSLGSSALMIQEVVCQLIMSQEATLTEEFGRSGRSDNFVRGRRIY